MINQDLLNEFSLKFGQSDFCDKELISNVFESGNVDFEINEIINNVNFNLIDQSNDSLKSSKASEYIKLKSTPSQIYSFLVNSFNSLTLNESEGPLVYYYLFDLNESVVTNDINLLLIFLGISNFNDILLEKSIFIEFFSESDIAIKGEYSFHTKLIDLKEYGSDYEILSSTYQKSMKTAVNTLFNFNKEFALDSLNSFKKMQHYHIMQSIRYFHYKNIAPLTSSYSLKFNRVKHVSERNGVLFFLINFFQSKDENAVDKQSILHYLISLGYLVQLPDGLQGICFENSANTSDNSYLSLKTNKDSIYFLLFRLFDSSISSKYQDLDKLIINKDFSSFDSLVFKLISSN